MDKVVKAKQPLTRPQLTYDKNSQWVDLLLGMPIISNACDNNKIYAIMNGLRLDL